MAATVFFPSKAVFHQHIYYLQINKNCLTEWIKSILNASSIDNFKKCLTYKLEIHQNKKSLRARPWAVIPLSNITYSKSSHQIMTSLKLDKPSKTSNSRKCQDYSHCDFSKIQCVERTQYRSGYLYVFHPSLIPYRHEISDRIVQHTSLITNSRAELKVTFKMNKMFYSSPFLYTYDVFALVLLIWSGYPCLFPCWVRVEVSQLTTIVILKTICNSGSAKSDFIQKSWLKNFGKFTFSYLLFCRKWAGVIFYWFLVWQHKWKTGVCKQFF